MMATTPHIVGYQAAGTIREVGADVTDREVGQRVTTVGPFGSHAAIRSVPSQSTWLVPDGLSIEEASAVPIPFGTADDCLFEFGHLAPAETVLVQGGGGAVGLAAIQLAKRAGARVFATASTDAKLERLAEFGVDEGINYRDADLVQAVNDLTDGVAKGVSPTLAPVPAKTANACEVSGWIPAKGNSAVLVATGTCTGEALAAALAYPGPNFAAGASGSPKPEEYYLQGSYKITSLTTTVDGAWVSYTVGAPTFVNAGFPTIGATVNTPGSGGASSLAAGWNLRNAVNGTPFIASYIFEPTP
jgi:threonine dehydrogenase-like Zn-dependent dehydrogenase